ncbi:MAG TPA: hypothetical protein VM571_13805 [Noviherbaspirillum sp.]|nr:hypothetical protein [Noviherbaspirillum sp.]
MTHNSLDAGIPVLTEIIPAPQPAEQEDTAPAALSTMMTVAAKEDVAHIDSPYGAPRRDDPQWHQLEQEIRERVLGEILERIDAVLEQRVRDSLADVLQTSVERLAADIRSGLHHTLKNAITHSLQQEIAKLHISKK